MIPSSIKRTLALAALLLSSASLACGQSIQSGDLIMGFRATGGNGADTNVFFNLGDPTTFRDGTNPTTFQNIGSVLSTVFGNNWYTREDMRFGAIANLSDKIPQGAPGIGTAAPVKGDPSRTVYASRATAAAGQATLFTGFNYQSLAEASRDISSLESIFADLGAPTGEGAIVLQASVNEVAWRNSWTKHATNANGYSFTVLPSIEQSFGQSGGSTHIDIQRIISIANGANPTGPVGAGQYVATITINSSGAITASKASGPSGGTFSTWAGTNNITGGLTGDSDNDGVLNIVEYALDLNLQGSDGSPGTFANGTWIFTKRAEAVTNGDVTYAIEVSDDLGVTQPWTVTQAAVNTPADIRFTLPAGKAKTFARLKVTSTAD
jgi:hypothetical protein